MSPVAQNVQAPVLRHHDKARIFIVSEAAAEVSVIRDLLVPDFDDVLTSLAGPVAVEKFQAVLPDVLILAFAVLAEAETQYLAIWRNAKEALHPHRAVVLCKTSDVRQAYAQCMRGIFDDYVQYWPMSLDPMRLAMSVHLAYRALVVDQLHERSAQQTADPAGYSSTASHADRSIASGTPPQATGRWSGQHNMQYQPSASRHPDQSPIYRGDAPSQGAAEQRHRTLLIVDDDPLQRSVVAAILRDQGYNLMFAANGLEALTVMQDTIPDVILLDVMMPEMDGAETILRIKAHHQYSRIPVLMMAGDSRGITVKSTIAAGARDFLVKPIVASILIDKIRRALPS